jgi:2-methylaconitate cis-trans-isomerase PrpF
MGGAVSSTSKTAIISPSQDSEYDVNYYFGQVAIDKPMIDYQGNCGNISSAVGPFAVDEGLVRATEPVTTVRIYQVNTKKRIVAKVPVKDGLYDETGDYAIAGVPGTGNKIALHFVEPGGSLTGKLLPTGNATDVIEVPGIGEIKVSIVDAANPVVFVKAEDLGLTGREIHEIDADENIRAVLEAIRARAAVMIGLAATPEEASEIYQAVPKVAFVSKSGEYRTVTGGMVKKNQIDLIGRIISMGALHKAYAGTGAICTAGASRIPGTVVCEMADGGSQKENIRIGHPGGIIEIGAKVEHQGEGYRYIEAIVGRTARRLMEGYVCVPERFF